MRRRGQFCVGGPLGMRKVLSHVGHKICIILSYPRACWLTTFACYAVKTTLKPKIWNPHKMRRWGQIVSVNRLPSKLINKQSTHINFPPTHFQPTPTGGENFLAILYFKLDYFRPLMTPSDLWWPRVTSLYIYSSSLTHFLSNELHFEALTSIFRNA